MSTAERYEPDIPRLIALLQDRDASEDLQDVLLSLLRCRSEDAMEVSDAIVARAEGEEDPLVADAFGEALGTLWAGHGAPPAGALERLPEVARTAARATYAALAGALLPEGDSRTPGAGR